MACGWLARARGAGRPLAVRAQGGKGADLPGPPGEEADEGDCEADDKTGDAALHALRDREIRTARVGAWHARALSRALREAAHAAPLALEAHRAVNGEAK